MKTVVENNPVLCSKDMGGYFLPSPERTRALTLGAATNLFQVDISKTLRSGSPTPDYTWSGELHISTEDINSVSGNTQIRLGQVHLALAYNALTNTWNTIAQMLIGGTSAATAGALSTAFAWSTNGQIATLAITPTATVVVPTSVKAQYFLMYATHTEAVEFV